MANTLLTPDMITREALRILHQKLNVVGNMVREYDDSFAQSGAKIGNTLRIRQPIQYGTGTGATMATGTGADTTEESVTLTVNSQRHVPMRFTSNELTMKIDDFSKRHIEPAMAVLAAKIENDVATNLADEMYQTVHAGTAVAFSEVMEARAKLSRSLAPEGDRCAILDPQANVDLVDALKGLFQDSSQIAKQYKEGMMGRTAGFDFYENTLIDAHTTGAEGGGTVYTVNGATQTGTSLVMASVNSVHPESKSDTGILQQFIARSDQTGAGTLTISPAIITSGPRQTVTASPANASKLTFLGAASTAYNQSLLFQKGFATFATADLVLPNGTDFASRQQYDGISMRIVRDYDVVKDRILTRCDVLYGYRMLRPQLAVKLLHT
jgi:hypothetical protein